MDHDESNILSVPLFVVRCAMLELLDNLERNLDIHLRREELNDTEFNFFKINCVIRLSIHKTK